MGCDIHTIVEVKTDGTWRVAKVDPPIFDYRNYGLFGFLAGVRNYSEVPAQWPERLGPLDLSDEVKAVESDWSECGYHNFTYVTLEELLGFDYDQTFENRRVNRFENGYSNGGATAEPGGGTVTTFRSFLGGVFFADVHRLAQVASGSPARVLMAFDN